MGTLYAFLVDVPRLFHDEKKIVCASSLEEALKWLKEHMREMRVDGRIESIVCVGEVVRS